MTNNNINNPLNTFLSMLFVYGLCNIEHILLIQDYVHLWGLLLFGKKHNGEKKLNTGTRSKAQVPYGTSQLFDYILKG